MRVCARARVRVHEDGFDRYFIGRQVYGAFDDRGDYINARAQDEK